MLETTTKNVKDAFFRSSFEAHAENSIMVMAKRAVEL